ncbi:MAG TPA: HEAT repeat domain-containing protein, partial [Methanothrix sp.]|nr:HEAT repeat domain-containing protein [Methanothrix sp.]
WSLGKIGGPRAVAPLIGALKDPYEPVRRNAAISLCRIGDPRAAEALTEALYDEAPSVQAAAVEALERIRSQPDISETR